MPVGPIHAGIIEPGRFRFAAQGETVVRLEERPGHTRKGAERLLEGADCARQFGARGHVGRASGCDFDIRRQLRHASRDMLRFDVPLRRDADVNARIRLHLLEVEQSLFLTTQMLDALPGLVAFWPGR